MDDQLHTVYRWAEGPPDQPASHRAEPPWITGEERARHRPSVVPLLAVVCALLLALCGVLGLAGWLLSGDNAKTAQPSTSPAVTRAETGSPVVVPTTKAAKRMIPVFKPGQTFPVGDFRITVHDRKCEIRQVGTTYVPVLAKGRFCQVDLSVTNAGDEPQYFDMMNFIYGYDKDGRRFTPDMDAGLVGNDLGAGIFDQVQPGTTSRAFVYFDMPEGSRLARLDFRPSVFTAGVSGTVRF